MQEVENLERALHSNQFQELQGMISGLCTIVLLIFVVVQVLNLYKIVSYIQNSKLETFQVFPMISKERLYYLDLIGICVLFIGDLSLVEKNNSTPTC